MTPAAGLAAAFGQYRRRALAKYLALAELVLASLVIIALFILGDQRHPYLPAIATLLV